MDECVCFTFFFFRALGLKKFGYTLHIMAPLVVVFMYSPAVFGLAADSSANRFHVNGRATAQKR